MNEFKICCFSALRVGQTTLLARFLHDTFIYDDPNFNIEDSYRKQITVDEKVYQLEILDAVQPESQRLVPVPQEVYGVMTEYYIRKANGILFSFSLTNRDSLAYAEKMIELTHKIRDVTDLPMFLIATKADLKADYKVSIEEGQTLANKYEIPFFVTSAKENLNVEKVFIELTRRMIAYRKTHPMDYLPDEKSRKGKCIVM